MSSPLYLAQRILEVLPPIVHRIRTQARVAVKGKITLPQFRILANIQRGQNSVGQIAEVLDVAQPTISKMIDGLVKKGLVKRTYGTEDRRQIQLSLTKKGIKVFEGGKKTVQIRLSQDFIHLPLRERENLNTALGQIEKAFKTLQDRTSTESGRHKLRA